MWVSVAPLGKPVVPLVYWMLIGSSGRQLSARARSVVPHAVGLGQQLAPIRRVEDHHPLQRGESSGRTSAIIAR